MLVRARGLRLRFALHPVISDDDIFLSRRRSDWHDEIRFSIAVDIAFAILKAVRERVFVDVFLNGATIEALRPIASGDKAYEGECRQKINYARRSIVPSLTLPQRISHIAPTRTLPRSRLCGGSKRRQRGF